MRVIECEGNRQTNGDRPIEEIDKSGVPSFSIISALPVQVDVVTSIVVPASRVDIAIADDDSLIYRSVEEVPSTFLIEHQSHVPASGINSVMNTPYEPYEIDPARHAEIDSLTYQKESVQRLSYNAVSAFCRGLSVNPHVFWLFTSLIIYMLVILLIIYGMELRNCRQNMNGDDSYSCSQVHVFAVSLPLVIFYTTHVCISLNSAFFRMLQNSDGGSVKVGNYVSSMCKGAPLIMHTAHCYHYEERPTRNPSKVNSRGRPPGSTLENATSNERIQVTKHVDRCQFHFLSFTDKSLIPNIYCYQIVIVEGEVHWDIVDPEVYQRFENEKAIFFHAHSKCDSHRDFNTYGTVKGFETSMLCCVDPEDVPFAIRHGAWTFRIMTILGLGWFYRVWLSGVCGKVQLIFKKEIVR